MSEGEWQDYGTRPDPAGNFHAAEVAALIELLALAEADAAAGRLLPIDGLDERIRAGK